MGRPKSPKDLLIYMNGEEVGRLATSSTGQLQLAYSGVWIQSNSARSLSLSLPLRSEPYRGPVVESFFENLLPDNEAVRLRMQTRFRAKSNRCYDLLWHAGRDCVGAIQLLPESEPMPDIKRIVAHPLTDSEIASILQNYRTVPLGMDPEEDDFRISIAGAQEKTALLWHNNQWCRPVGTTPTSHIFKLPIGRTEKLDLRHSVENEWLCHMILKAYNIPVADAAMVDFEGTRALAVTRFDRRLSEDGSWIIRLPQEDFCQSLGVPPALKYENHGGPGIVEAMELLVGSETSEADRYLFMKVQVLFWLLAAIDGHAKNFSIFLLPGDKYRLTPMYDVMSVHPMINTKQLSVKRAKMAMGIYGKNKHYVWDRIKPHCWAKTSQMVRFSDKNLVRIFEELLDGMDLVIDKVKGQIPSEFPSDIAESIFEGMLAAKLSFTTHLN